MDKIAKRKLSNALIFPFLSCTILNVSGFPACAQMRGGNNFLENILSGPKGSAGNDMVVVSTAGAVGPTVTALEEEVRQLTGKVEELNFMILQMQTQLNQLRHTRQDKETASAIAVPGDSALPEHKTGKQERIRAQADKLPDNAANTPDASSAGSKDLMQSDRQVKITGSGKNAPAATDTPAQESLTGDVPQTGTPKELYQLGYQHILAGDYRAAEVVFRAFQQRYPDDPLSGDASFWLGEALYGQGRYREAAQVYINVQRT